MNDDPELLAIFRAEVMEPLDALSSGLGTAPETWEIDRLFRPAHNVKGAARLVGATAIHDVAHVLEDLFSALREGRSRDPEVVALARAGGDHLDRARAADERGDGADASAFRRAVTSALQAAPPAPAAPVAVEPVAVPPIAPAVIAAAPLPSPRPVAHAARTAPGEGDAHGSEWTSDTTLRVSLDRVDTLAELESVVDRATLHRETASGIAARLQALTARQPELQRVPAVVEALRLARDLRDDLERTRVRGALSCIALHEGIRALRMVRVDILGATLRGVVRDACRASGRDAELRILGGQTEIDRVVLDRLRDPLVHLIRNAIAHGLEDAATRERTGKPPAGKIDLVATTAGPWVDVVVTDDGRGIDVDAIRAAAVERGLVDAAVAAAAGRDAIFDFMFIPGFSTAVGVSELAGRGVGLDVVRGNVAAIGGTVAVTSVPTEGTTFSIRVPLTRLTTRGIIVRIADQRLAFPTSSVERTMLVDAADVSRVDGADALLVGGRLVPVASFAGYAVTQAVDGREALGLIETQPFDVVVTDVEMPFIDGIELTRMVRARPESSTLPIILVTSRGSDEHRRRGAEAGADAYIVKGAFDQDELLTTVARLL